MHTQRHFQYTSLIFTLLVILSACGLPTGSKSSPVPTTPPSPTISTRATQTCPTSGNARAAIMPPMPNNNHPSLLYSSQSPDATTSLLLYDTTTSTTTTLAKGDIALSSISPNHQWLLFTSMLQNQSAIQLIHTDGQYLQTLYCAPSFTTLTFSPDQHSLAFIQTGAHDPATKIFTPQMATLALLDLTTGHVQLSYSGPGLNNLLFSPDQHSLAFVEEDTFTNNTHILKLLDLTTAKIHTVMSSQLPGFPKLLLAQSPTTTQPSSSLLSFSHKHNDYGYTTNQALSPLPSGNWDSLLPLQWANNQSLFVLLRRSGSPRSTLQLYLLHDITKDASQQQNNLQYIVANDDPAYLCDIFTLTPDGQQLLCANSPSQGRPSPATITIRPATGGIFHTIYSGPTDHVTATILSNSTLIITQLHLGQPDTLSKLNTDGTGLTRLMQAPSADKNIESPILSNGSLFALATYGNNEISLLIGSLNATPPTTIVKTLNNQLQLIGWSQL